MNQEQIIRGLQLASASQPTTDKKIHEPIEINALFISDVHLGYKGSAARELVGFLNHVKPKYIYLVGDIVDGWSLDITRIHHIGRLFISKSAKAQMRLPQGHADVIQKLLRFARNGSYVFYIPGNHDELARPSLSRMPDMPEDSINKELTFKETARGVTAKVSSAAERNEQESFRKLFGDMAQIGNIAVLPQIVHKTVDNRRLLVMHGDEFDFLIKNRRYLGIIGTKARDSLFAFSQWLARNDKYWLVHTISRKIFGLGEKFSLANYIRKFKSNADMALPSLAIQFVKTRNDIILQRKKSSPDWSGQPLLDGFVGGHNHIPAMVKIDGLDYHNCGDWVGNNTALIEHTDGRMELVTWDERKGIVPFVAPDKNPAASTVLLPPSSPSRGGLPDVTPS